MANRLSIWTYIRYGQVLEASPRSAACNKPPGGSEQHGSQHNKADADRE